MSTLIWAVLLPVLVVGFIAGWAARRSEDGAYLQRRAQFLAQQMVSEQPAPVAAPPAYRPNFDDVVDAEVVFAHATRTDRLEVTR